jgi:predicted PolB exonuclease-like 3'-5' exonuclease
MIKFVADEVWAIDTEWVPDVPTGRRVYDLGPEVTDLDVLHHMFCAGGASEEEPRPYLKTVLCRVVSVAALIRRKGANGSVSHRLVTLPRYGAPAIPEVDLLRRFLTGIGKIKPQLVGFNITEADLPILLQRAAVCGVTALNFCARPKKPWEGRDYFTRYTDWLLDLRQLYGGRGRSTPSLHELACAARIPGKIDISGKQMIDLWLKGDISKIVAYNEFDALTTFLLWLRTARLAGLISAGEAAAEEATLRHYLTDLIAHGRQYLDAYLKKWDALHSDLNPSTSGSEIFIGEQLQPQTPRVQGPEE